MKKDLQQTSSGDQSPNVVTQSGSVSITYNSSKDALLRVIPDYVHQLLSLLSGSRRFFADFGPVDNKLFTQGFVFLSISSLLSFVLRIPMVEIGFGYWGQALSSTVFYLATGLILGVLAFICCRLAGGKGALRGHLGIFSYMAGVSAVLFTLISLLAQGIMLIQLKDQFPLYQEYMRLLFAGDELFKDPRFATFHTGWALRTSMGVLFGGTLLILCWMAYAWRALGDLHKLSAVRVLLSLALFLFMGYWVNAILAELQAVRGISIF